MTVADAINECRRALQDTSSDTTLQRRTDAMFVEKLNAASRHFVVETACLKKEDATLTLTEDSQTRTLPTDFLAFDPQDIVGGKGGVILDYEALSYVTVGYLDAHTSGWREASSDTPSKWAIKDLETLVFDCPASATAAAYNLVIRYVMAPTALSASDTTVVLLEDIPALLHYHILLSYYAIKECAKEDGDNALSDRFQAIWDKGLETAKRQLGSMIFMRGELRADSEWTAGWVRPPS